MFEVKLKKGYNELKNNLEEKSVRSYERYLGLQELTRSCLMWMSKSN